MTFQHIFRNPSRLLVLLAAVLFLSACKVELYSNLQEQEVNEMLAILLRHGISSQKMPGDENLYNLHVDENKLAESVELLKQLGYPRDQFESMGQIFKKEGLISSPLEERIRFIYALSQEIGKTISQIDGVVSARVHIVLPENNPLSDSLTPASASVFVKYREETNVTANVPQIKKLVTNSIEGLSYDKVTVAMFAAEAMPEEEGPVLTKVLGMQVENQSLNLFYGVFGFLTVLLVAAVAAAVVFFQKLKAAGGLGGKELAEASADA
ncbi:type III secretion system inner membrane ring lipoprotein SctJ [Acanthopleuribacter pedis]|uniref:Type III secretion inner membrane ring lipoprotein SctJ n=1 Tax=Acanthopleuribacter pedis TaxID=442870 RepID=A0A8J7U6A6_9BACT|nr:type III secretion inner membrane ring lipoprotein SctJ [Acanthopleuribacter pedis]MBO1322592.1 type III secretion inner membrane ring lipoprotein SctJ [Acanthopleuribacter pedis]